MQDERSAGIVVGKAWMRSNEGLHEFNPPSSQEWSSSRAKTRPSHPPFSSTLPPSLPLSTHARTHYSNHRTIHCEKDRNIKTWNAFFILARTRYRGRFRPSSGKHLQIDPWPDSKYVETSCSIRLGYYRGLGHRTGFLESSAKCAPDWTDTLEGCRATRIRDKPTPDPINFGQRAPTDFSNSSPRKDKRVLSFLENARERKETRDRSRRGREISGNTNGAIRNNSRGRRGTSWLRRIYEFN